LDASVLTSGRDLNYGRGSYDIILNGRGTHLGGSYSALHYLLGKSLSALEGHGTAQVASLWTRQPLLRTRDLNLYAQLQFDRKELRDHIDVSAIHTDRHLDNWTASLAGDWRDGLLGGGTNSGSAQWVRGSVGFDDATAQRTDAATARTQGRFSQWIATLARLQFLNANNALYIAVSSQWANANLDPSQKLVAGGRYTVRAYDMSAASGDTGVQATAEVRHDLTSARHGQWQMVTFLDAERVTVNRNVWTSGKNDATLRGAGVGLNWTSANRWSAKASLAARLGAAPSLVGSSSPVRGWLELSKGF
jgi:hemolysin activation/secretion protein